MTPMSRRGWRHSGRHRGQGSGLGFRPHHRRGPARAILDDPSNHGHPTYWHARGYGLFAANPLGRQGYDPKQEPTSLTLKPGESVTFRHRIVILDGKLAAAELQKEYDSYAAGGQR